MTAWLHGLFLLAVTQTGAAPRELLERATNLYRDLEYDQVVPITEKVLETANLSAEQRIQAYVLQASSLAVMGDEVGAEKPFRFLLRARPEFELPSSTPPKILALFRKVQVEERRLYEELQEIERQKMLKETTVTGGPEPTAKGGEPIVFEYQVRDPRGLVTEVRVNYRKPGEGVFSALALKRTEIGTWRAELPGQWTESSDGLEVDYYVSTHDSEHRSLVSVGSASEPKRIKVEPGSFDASGPLVQQPWFWAVVGSAVIGASVGGFFLYRNSTAPPSSELGVVEYR